MRTIRRLYIYAISFISLEVVLWGLIGLARSVVSGDAIGGARQLASALSLVIVGVPVYLLHWWVAQRSLDDPQERSARLRAVFLYGALLSTLIPVTQNLLALTNRLWLQLLGLPASMAFLGERQTVSDNLIAIALNALLAAYLARVLQRDWEAGPTTAAFPETRRLYRYLWMLYGLAMMVGGTQQVLTFVFTAGRSIGMGNGASLANGLSLLTIGTPLWVFWWRVIQKSLAQADERQSSLRIAIHYLISLSGAVGSLIPAGILLETLIRGVLGEPAVFTHLLAEIGAPLAMMIPFTGVWFYFGTLLHRAVNALDDTPRRAGYRRLYSSILAFMGLVALFLGLNALLALLIDLTILSTAWGASLRDRLSVALATLTVGTPLWWVNWRALTAEAAQEGETGDHARRSRIRKAYLYLVLFASVLGVMFSGGSLVFQLLSKLFGQPAANFQRASWVLLEMLVLFALLLAYHWSVLRADGRKAAHSLAARYEAFPVLVLTPEIGDFSEKIVTALKREAPSIPLAVHTVDNGIPDETLSMARAVILPGELAAFPPEAIRIWLQGFDGTRLVVPTPVQGWLWTFGSGKPLSSLVSQTAKIIRHLAEGEPPPKEREISGWMILFYLLAGLMGIPLVIGLFSLLAKVLRANL